MPEEYRRDWVERADEIASLIRNKASRTMSIGGRFVCDDESEDDPMYFYLEAQGFSLSDVEQCEVFASKSVTISEAAIHDAISELRLIASERGYRLQSVEVGEPEEGKARVIASEQDYVPWWSNGELPTIESGERPFIGPRLGAGIAIAVFLLAAAYTGYVNELLKPAISPPHRVIVLFGFVIGAGAVSRYIAGLTRKRNGEP